MQTTKKITATVSATSCKGGARKEILVCLVCLLGVLGVLFHSSFNPDKVLFANDGPLGAQTADFAKSPEAFMGMWQDLNSYGTDGGSSSPNLTSLLLFLFGPLYFTKVFVPSTLLIVGICAWFFFRQSKLAWLACLLGGLAAALNSAFFSASCWGVGPQTICFGMNYLALGILAMKSTRWPWLRFLVAGLALGMGVMEGADVGAIFSLLFAAFVFYSALTGEGALGLKVLRGVGGVALIALFAGFVAAQTVNVLVSTSIKGIAGTPQDTRTKEERWDFATQWSLPKRETLSLIIPGLFGYGMNSPEGGNYWGAIGRDPAWDRYFKGGKQGPPPSPERFMRQSGGGVYVGILVAVVALWAALQSLRKKDSVFTLPQRKFLWFWIGTCIVSLLFAFGRFAPFYQFYRIFHALPLFSSTRNPAKFVHVVDFATVILFAYGIHGLFVRYMEPASAGPSVKARAKNWWAEASQFDKRWISGCVIAVVVSLLGWLVYASARTSLEQYLQTVQFDDSMARAIAGFSIKQAGWFVLFLALTMGLVLAILKGRFAGERATVGAVLLGLLLVVDLGRANLPWIIYWDYKEKYATNPVLDFLRERPYEHRVAILPFQAPPQFSTLNQLYRIEWAQHHFLYYNIQSLDIVQMPRMPLDMVAFERALSLDGTSNTVQHMTRRWELSNTRYLIGAAGFLNVLNEQIDPLQHRFRIAAAFNIVPKPGIPNPTRFEEVTAVMSPQGQYAIFEFTGALPRAKLYPNWQSSTNDQATLDLLGSASFDPARTVIVDHAPPTASTSTNQNGGTVEFDKYAPTRILLHARATSPSILLLNDRYDPNWKVSVDGHPEALLRCNYIMRGVQVPFGEHQIEFRFAPPIKVLYISIAAILLGLGLAGILAFSKPEEEKPIQEISPGTKRPMSSKT